MAQETRVLKLSPPQAMALEQALHAGLTVEAEWRSVPHARFSVKALGVVATCYNSGKLVLQGTDVPSVVDRFLGDLPNAAEPSRGAAKPGPGQQPGVSKAIVGSDEAGKGDYFGPLVVAAVYANPDQLQWLQALGVADSKKVADNRAHTLAAQIEAQLECQIVRLMPIDYNERYEQVNNLNPMLASLHGEALSPLILAHPESPVLVDKFADDRLVASALAERGAKPAELICVPRAESHPVVAAASLLARSAFLQGLAECGDLCGTELHKGAGAPVDRVARRVLEIGGKELLRKVAKLHFRNTQKLPS